MLSYDLIVFLKDNDTNLWQMITLYLIQYIY